jgi:DNA mismatch endonuclease (patch repair protein)
VARMYRKSAEPGEPKGRSRNRKDWASSSQPERTIGLGGGARVAYPQPVSAAASAAMRGNRKRDTQPELAVRRLLHARGYRYRVNAPISLPDVRVRPDITFRALKVAIFIDGCFWHGCPKHGTRPRSNSYYWRAKIERNISRDRIYDRALRSAGWRVIRVWEHDDPERAVARISAKLAKA